MIEDFENLLNKLRLNHEKTDKFLSLIKQAIFITSIINSLLFLNMKLIINIFSEEKCLNNFSYNPNSFNYPAKKCNEMRDGEYLNIMTGFSIVINFYLIYQKLIQKKVDLHHYSLIEKSELYRKIYVLLFFVFSQFLYIIKTYLNKSNSLLNCGEAYNSNIYISIVNLITILEFSIKNLILVSIWKTPEKESETQVHLGSDQTHILIFHLKSFFIILIYQFISIFVFCTYQKYFFTSFMNNLAMVIVSYFYSLYYNYKIQIHELNQKHMSIQAQMESNKIETKAKSLYLAKVAHEYKNILISIVNICNNQNTCKQSNFNLESSSEDEQQSRCNLKMKTKVENETSSKLNKSCKLSSNNAGFILALCNYMLILIQDLNVFTKMENASKPEENQSLLNLSKHKEDSSLRSIIPEVDLLSALNFCLNIFIIRQKNDPNKRGIKLLTNYEIDGYIRVSIPETRLKQVVINLLSNAYKFTISGQIILSAKKFEDEEGKKFLRISVSDTGLGISQNERMNLFNPFKTIQRNQEFNCHGSGLGLSIVNDLLTSINSKLEFTSEKNIGSNFWFDVQDVNINHKRQSSGHISFYSKLNSSDSNAETLIFDQNLIITESQKNIFFSLARNFNNMSRYTAKGAEISKYSNSHINSSLFDINSYSSSRKNSVNKDEREKSKCNFNQIIPENADEDFSPNNLYNLNPYDHKTENKLIEDHFDTSNIKVLNSSCGLNHSKSNSISSINLNFQHENEKLTFPILSSQGYEEFNNINKIVNNVSSKKINLSSKSKFNKKEQESKTTNNINMKNTNFHTSEGLTFSRSESPRNFHSKKNSNDSLVSVNKVNEENKKFISIENVNTNFSQNIQFNFNIENIHHNEISLISPQKNNLQNNNFSDEVKKEGHFHEAGCARIKETKFCNKSTISKHSSSGSQNNFTMSPCGSRKSHRHQPSLSPNKIPSQFKLRIILCDDDQQICQPTSKFIKKICKEKQIEVSVMTCNNGIECIYLIYQEFLKRNFFDILFIDETMPFIKGSLVTKVLKTMISDKQINNILIYSVTAYEDKDILKAISVNGCDGILHKPVNKSAIEKIIQINFFN